MHLARVCELPEANPLPKGRSLEVKRHTSDAQCISVSSQDEATWSSHIATRRRGNSRIPRSKLFTMLMQNMQNSEDASKRSYNVLHVSNLAWNSNSGPLKHINILSTLKIHFFLSPGGGVCVSHIRCEMPRGWSTLGHWRFGQCWLVRDLIGSIFEDFEGIRGRGWRWHASHCHFDPCWSWSILASTLSLSD